MIPLQRNMMHNFGYSKSTTADETVIVDCYCFVIAICSHHLVMSLALTPVVVLGWDSAGSVGQFPVLRWCRGRSGILDLRQRANHSESIFPSQLQRLGCPAAEEILHCHGLLASYALHHADAADDPLLPYPESTACINVVAARCRWHLLPAELLQVSA